MAMIRHRVSVSRDLITCHLIPVSAGLTLLFICCSFFYYTRYSIHSAAYLGNHRKYIFVHGIFFFPQKLSLFRLAFELMHD